MHHPERKCVKMFWDFLSEKQHLNATSLFNQYNNTKYMISFLEPQFKENPNAGKAEFFLKIQVKIKRLNYN